MRFASSSSFAWSCSFVALVCGGCIEDVRIGIQCELNSDCPSPLVCGFGRCRSECRERVDCEAGQSCLFDPETGLGSCSTAADVCDSDDDCDDSLRCALQRCVNTCTGDDDCLPGDRCWSVPALESAFCVDPGQQPEAGMPVVSDGGLDASIGDAGAGDAGDGGTSCVGPDCDPIRRVAMGWQHVCAMTESGRLFCWGRDLAGEATGTRPAKPHCGAEYCRTRPTEVTRLGAEPGGGGTPLAAIDAALGDSYSCALLAGGRVQCWGTPRPAPPRGDTAEPALVELAPDEGPVRDVLAIHGGRAHVLMERSDGLYGVGVSDRGQLRSTTSSEMAVRIGDRPALVRAGAFFGCEVQDGTVACWGSNSERELGRDVPAPTPSAFDATPRPVEDLGIGPAVGLVAGGQHACAYDATGRIECWGQARDRTDRVVPPEVVMRGGVVLRDLVSSSAADTQLTCGRSDASPARAYCFGRSGIDARFYPPGTSDTTRAVLMWPAVLTDVDQVATDGQTACAVQDGDLWCWGSNTAGQLGQGDGAAHDGPVRPRW